MEKIQLSKDVVIYRFTPDGHRHFGFNLLTIQHENRVLLIDTGYEHHTKVVLEDLKNNHLTLEKVVITHYHEDHIFGLKILPKVPIYGSHAFKQTLNRWTDKALHDHFIPTHIIDKETNIQFYHHQLKMIPFPGHSVCEMLILINQRYLCVGDEIMLSNQGLPLLPYVDKIGENTLQRHLHSLELLKDYKDYILIPSHGILLTTIKEIEEDLNNRIRYFKNIINSTKQLRYEEAIEGCTCSFLHPEWFKGIYN